MYFPAAEIGLQAAEGAWIYLPPNIAGYVGADHVSALVATRSYIDNEHTSLLVDIGTNTEISLIHAGRVLSCSCASGPAFEGAHIRDGMRAAPGAIERVHMARRYGPPADDRRPAGGGHLRLRHPQCGRRDAGCARSSTTAVCCNQKTPRVRLANGKSEFLLVPAARYRARARHRRHAQRHQRDPTGERRHPRRIGDFLKGRPASRRTRSMTLSSPAPLARTWT